MDENKSKQTNNDVHIEQVNPRKELNDLEKTVILQFKIDKKIEEELSKTTQFKMLNSKTSGSQLDLPKKSTGLTDTIKIKISDLRAAIEAQEQEMPVLKKKKSLYDTVVIKLDDLINNRKALSRYHTQKVTSIEEPMTYQKKFHFIKPRDITKDKALKLNVDSEEYGRQLYNLNKIALNVLSSNRPKKVRKYTSLSKIQNIEKLQVSKNNYLKYQQRLQKFAINKLYYKFAPKESGKYKLYKYSVILSSMVFFVTAAVIVNWFVQGLSINSLSNSLMEDAPIVQIEDGTLVNIDPEIKDDLTITDEAPEPEVDQEYSNKKTMYWKYLNTPLSSVDFTSLLKQNSDTVGWLIVNDTNVNYPVVQTSNNDYYLKHAFDKSSNSAGWVYADFRNNFDELSKNTVIYAHGRKDKVMFGSLTNTLKSNWYTNVDNQIIQFSTLKYNTMWQIISIYKIEAESYYITTDFSSTESFLKFGQTMLDRSIYDFGVDVNEDDKLLTLSTCYNDNGIRLVVQAKLVKIQER
jgi:sortase B